MKSFYYFIRKRRERTQLNIDWKKKSLLGMAPKKTVALTSILIENQTKNKHLMTEIQVVDAYSTYNKPILLQYLPGWPFVGRLSGGMMSPATPAPVPVQAPAPVPAPAGDPLQRWISVGCGLNVTLNSALQAYAQPILDKYLKSIPR